MRRFNLILLIGLAFGILSRVGVAQEPPFTGIISDEKVHIRSGADERFYSVGLLSRGDLIKVREVLAGWYKIEPPAGSFSYVDKQFIAVEAGGRTGKATESRVRVLAPSSTGPRESFKTQLALDKGATVKILGEQEGYYKIAPPEGVHLFVHQKYVEVATPEQVAAAEGQAPAPDKKTLEGATQAKPAPVAEKPAEKPAAPVPPVVEAPRPTPSEVDGPGKTPLAASPGAFSATVAADGSILYAGKSYDRESFASELQDALKLNPGLEVQLRADKQAKYEDVLAAMDIVNKAGVKKLNFVREQAVATTPPGPGEEPKAAEAPAAPAGEEEAPVVATPPQLDELERRFNDASKLPLTDQPLADLRVEYEKLLTEPLSAPDMAKVKARIEIIENRREIQMKLVDVTSYKKELQAAEEDRKKIDLAKPKVYVSVGRLLTSSLYTGDRLPLLYRIVDQANGLTVAYVRPVANQDHALYIGQYVGVVGEKEYDPSLKLNVIRTKEIEILEPKKVE